MKAGCDGHLNDFQHFDGDLQGLQERFDVGYKFSVEEPLGSYSGPILVLYLSIQPLPQGDGLIQSKEESLRYELRREEWGDITEVRDTDEARLLERSMPKLIENLKDR